MADNKYTELEWSLRLQTPAAETEVYQFRVYAGSTPLDGYDVTPAVTVSGLVVGMITCAVDGAALRRIVTGPVLAEVDVTGPSKAFRTATGPVLAARTVFGPALTTRVVTGPATQTHRVSGPDVDRDVTGPMIEHFAVTGPGVCG